MNFSSVDPNAQFRPLSNAPRIGGDPSLTGPALGGGTWAGGAPMGPPQSPRADGLMFGGGGAAGGGARVSGPGSASMSEVWGVGHQLVKYPRLKGSPTGLNYSMNTTFTPYGGGGGHGGGGGGFGMGGGHGGGHGGRQTDNDTRFGYKPGELQPDKPQGMAPGGADWWGNHAKGFGDTDNGASKLEAFAEGGFPGVDTPFFANERGSEQFLTWDGHLKPIGDGSPGVYETSEPGQVIPAPEPSGFSQQAAPPAAEPLAPQPTAPEPPPSGFSGQSSYAPPPETAPSEGLAPPGYTPQAAPALPPDLVSPSSGVLELKPNQHGSGYSVGAAAAYSPAPAASSPTDTPVKPVVMSHDDLANQIDTANDLDAGQRSTLKGQMKAAIDRGMPMSEVQSRLAAHLDRAKRAGDAPSQANNWGQRTGQDLAALGRKTPSIEEKIATRQQVLSNHALMHQTPQQALARTEAQKHAEAVATHEANVALAKQQSEDKKIAATRELEDIRSGNRLELARHNAAAAMERLSTSLDHKEAMAAVKEANDQVHHENDRMQAAKVIDNLLQNGTIPKEHQAAMNSMATADPKLALKNAEFYMRQKAETSKDVKPKEFTSSTGQVVAYNPSSGAAIHMPAAEKPAPATLTPQQHIEMFKHFSKQAEGTQDPAVKAELEARARLHYAALPGNGSAPQAAPQAAPGARLVSAGAPAAANGAGAPADPYAGLFRK